MKKISIIIGCYNEELNVNFAYDRLTKILQSLKKYTYEIIFVDNKSTDKTRELIEKLVNKDKHVKGIFLSRNFGPEASGQAGFDLAEGDAFIGLAADLQDPPGVIPRFVREWEKGYDAGVGIYTNTTDKSLMRYVRKAFYRVYKSISNIDVPQNSTGFGIYDKKVIDALKSLPEKYRFNRGLTEWVGFNKKYIKYERNERKRGKSSYRFLDYLKFSERGLFGFSYLPLDMLVYGGLILVLASFIFIAGYLYTVIAYGNPINASIPLMLAIVFFGGITMLAISILGKYIQVIVEETKARPIYIIEKKLNFKN